MTLLRHPVRAYRNWRWAALNCPDRAHLHARLADALDPAPGPAAPPAVGVPHKEESA